MRVGCNVTHTVIITPASRQQRPAVWRANRQNGKTPELTLPTAVWRSLRPEPGSGPGSGMEEHQYFGLGNLCIMQCRSFWANFCFPPWLWAREKSQRASRRLIQQLIDRSP